MIISSSRDTAAVGKELRAFAYDYKEVANELLAVLEETPGEKFSQQMEKLRSSTGGSQEEGSN